MTNNDKAEEIIKKLGEVAYLAIGKELGENIKGKKVYLSGPITYCRNYKGLFMFAEYLAKLCDATQVFSPASQIPDCLDYGQAMKRCALSRPLLVKLQASPFTLSVQTCSQVR